MLVRSCQLVLLHWIYARWCLNKASLMFLLHCVHWWLFVCVTILGNVYCYWWVIPCFGLGLEVEYIVFSLWGGQVEKSIDYRKIKVGLVLVRAFWLVGKRCFWINPSPMRTALSFCADGVLLSSKSFLPRSWIISHSYLTLFALTYIYI